MLASSVIPNRKSIGPVRFLLNDLDDGVSYYANVNSPPRHDWYLKAWMAALKVRQIDIMKATDYSRATVSDLVNGGQRYNRDILNAVAAALHIRPYELLMHPDEAMAIRRVRESAVRIAAEGRPQDPEASEGSASFG